MGAFSEYPFSWDELPETTIYPEKTAHAPSSVEQSGLDWLMSIPLLNYCYQGLRDATKNIRERSEYSQLLRYSKMLEAGQLDISDTEITRLIEHDLPNRP
jgi:hypothetical protein